MNKVARVMLQITAFGFAGISLLSQTTQTPKPSFDVVSIKPNVPAANGIRGGGGGTRGNKYTMTAVTLKQLLQQAYRQADENPGQLQINGGPAWIDSDRYDIQATVDCSGGILSREQVQLMVQSMLEDRFQVKAHMETREMPIYNLVVGKDGPKLKLSEDQSAPMAVTGGPPMPCGPVPAAPLVPALPPPPPPGGGLPSNFALPRGAVMMMMSSTGMTLQASGVPISTLIATMQQQTGRPVVDKTELKGLFDYKLQFSPEGLSLSGPPGGFAPPPPSGAAGSSATPASSSDPIPSLFTAIQELGLKLESAKGPIKVLVVDSVQKPSLN